VDLRGLQRLLEGERGQNAGEPFRQHQLARAGRPDHQHIVAFSGGHFQSPLCRRLTPHITEIRNRLIGGHCDARNGRKWLKMLRLSQVRHDLGEVAHAEHPNILSNPRLGGIVGWNHDVHDATLPRTDGDGSAAFASPIAPRIPMAMGRSNPTPSLRTLAGARLMVTAFLGYSPRWRTETPTIHTALTMVAMGSKNPLIYP
jgi:hypothetical protein